MVSRRLAKRRRSVGALAAAALHTLVLAGFACSFQARATPGMDRGAGLSTMSVSLLRSDAVKTVTGSPDAAADATSRVGRRGFAGEGFVVRAALDLSEGKGHGGANAPVVAAAAAAPSTVMLNTTAAGAYAGAGSDYQRRLLAHLEPFKRYPAGAGEAGAHGTVQLVFEIERGGGVLGVWVAKSSGFAILDEAAVDMVHRAQPVPSIPEGLPDLLTVQLPVAFSERG